ncbi:MAG TPA: hypothetical protein PK629_00740 [Oscillospiraceae bacterium]|nr:hypothetical protein [Oscillospiraceae bacterium]HPF56509.1 hypothetical protein [Clostridiales bacterium]HPK34531.1 hypothetical protein [Oscillospiraceae bacterium]HPR74759.1 hypothetical protein [Oscillospiraceae bacterium]
MSSIVSEPPIEEDPGYFIFLDNMLVGSYHDNQWHTIENRELSIADYLKQYAYYCYSQTELIGISKKLTFMYDCEANDSFANDGKPLIPYAQEHNGLSKMTFYIPFELPQDLRYIKSQTYNTNIIFNVEYAEHYFPLVLSTDFNPLPKSQIKQITGSSEADKVAVKTELEHLGVPDAPINITECFEFDYNNDGSTEHFVIANAPRDEWGYVFEYSPFYYMVLIKDKTGYKTVTSWSRSNDRVTADQFMELIGFFDLNNDGIFELCLYKQEWEWHHVYVYSLNDQSEWECVLTGSGGM